MKINCGFIFRFDSPYTGRNENETVGLSLDLTRHTQV